MESTLFRRAALDEKIKNLIRQKVRKLLDKKSEGGSGKEKPESDSDADSKAEPEERSDRVLDSAPAEEEEVIEDDGSGEVYLFDENEDGETEDSQKDGNAREAIAMRIAKDFPTQDALEKYLKEFPDADRSKHKVVKMQKTAPKPEEKGEERKPGEEDDSKEREKGKEDESKEKKPGKDEDSKGKSPVKDEKKAPVKKDNDEEAPQKNVKEIDKKGPTQQDKEEDKGEVAKPEKKDVAPTEVKDTGSRQIAIKDSLIDMFGTDAKNWNVHSVHESQLTEDVVINFPDGSKKRYKELSEQEKGRVHKALGDGLAAHKGLNDYTKVDVGTMTKNMQSNLSRVDDASVEEPVIEDEESLTKENVKKFTSQLKTNGRTVINKYRAAMSEVSRPMLEHHVDSVVNAIKEGVSDGSLSGVSPKDLDEFFREDLKRMISQETETRRRSLGDHGIRHLAGNTKSSLNVLDELQKGGVPVNGKHKLMAATIMANHDLGYTVGGAATDVKDSGKHKDQSKNLAEQEKKRYEKVFGGDGAKQIVDVIGTHDTPDLDWDKDPVGSAVRLADNTSLFGNDKVQDLFIRSPKALNEACKLRLAAQMEPPKPKEPDIKDFAGKPNADEEYKAASAKHKVAMDEYNTPEVQARVKEAKGLQDAIKKSMHTVIDDEWFDDIDNADLHRQVDEMSEGKFSTTKDILSRFSGRLQGFRYNSDKNMVSVDMKYSPEGHIVDELFGDEVAAKQFNKFIGDLSKNMKESPGKMTGKNDKKVFKNKDGKPVLEMNVAGTGRDQSKGSTGAMRGFLDKTIRSEVNKASEVLRKTGDVEKVKKTVEKARHKLTEAEWEQLMEAIESGSKGDLAMLAEKLGAWPLIESELSFMKGKMASLSRIASRVAFAEMGDKIARHVLSKRGQQTRRKDRDLMRDTGGSSKVEREPANKPPRDDSRVRYREKTKTEDDRVEVGGKDKERKALRPELCAEMLYGGTRATRTASWGGFAISELSKYPRRFVEAVMRV